jgi:hypothetical protein
VLFQKKHGKNHGLLLRRSPVVPQSFGRGLEKILIIPFFILQFFLNDFVYFLKLEKFDVKTEVIKTQAKKLGTAKFMT